MVADGKLRRKVLMVRVSWRKRYRDCGESNTHGKLLYPSNAGGLVVEVIDFRDIVPCNHGSNHGKRASLSSDMEPTFEMDYQ